MFNKLIDEYVHNSCTALTFATVNRAAMLKMGKEALSLFAGALADTDNAAQRIGSGLAAQVGMVGPMSTILMGVLLLGEPFTGWVVAGTLLVLAMYAVMVTFSRGGYAAFVLALLTM